MMQRFGKQLFSNLQQQRTLSSLGKVGKLNHIAFAVPESDSQVKFFRDVLGLKPQKEHGVYTTFVDFGNTKLELLEPLGESGPIHKFVEKNPRGAVHHFCYEVENLQALIDELAKNGIKPLEPPKIGAHGNPVIFLHPRDCHGMLTEFEQVDTKVGKDEK